MKYCPDNKVPTPPTTHHPAPSTNRLSVRVVSWHGRGNLTLASQSGVSESAGFNGIIGFLRFSRHHCLRGAPSMSLALSSCHMLWELWGHMCGLPLSPGSPEHKFMVMPTSVAVSDWPIMISTPCLTILHHVPLYLGSTGWV